MADAQMALAKEIYIDGHLAKMHPYTPPGRRKVAAWEVQRVGVACEEKTALNEKGTTWKNPVIPWRSKKRNKSIMHMYQKLDPGSHGSEYG